ncbi:MAG TPA: hypothetical protein H9829_10635 [Candidatus Tetragenococcus pullicola]|nr:hypothetical protein [Candidatus Tetragenococcus pullicola]
MRDQIQQSIVPVELMNQLSNEPIHSEKPTPTKLAAKIQVNGKEIRIYNGIDKYILYALLKELK